VALALGEANHLDGRAVITAIAAGYDCFGAIQPAVKAAQRVRGLDHKGQAGSIAAAAVAGKLLGLAEVRLGHALALAAEMACGTEQYTYDAGLCDTESLTAGFGIRNGIQAAQMAAFGFRGAPGALDGPYGYFHAFGDGFDPRCLEQLGKVSMVATTGFKPHTGCRHVHACVDATQQLLQQGRPPLDEIVAIEVGSYLGAVTPDFRVNPHPQDAEAAGYSLPATVAVVLARGSWYREDVEAFDQPEIRRLWPLVKVYLDEEIEAAYPAKNGCVVRVTTRDGRRFEGRVDYAKGEPENMLTDAELEAKFRRVAGDLLPAAQIDRLLDTVAQLESLSDIGALVRLAA
jgi:2-methylcitrate dehydratase PrpD